jgi:hypothetical protein
MVMSMGIPGEARSQMAVSDGLGRWVGVLLDKPGVRVLEVGSRVCAGRVRLGVVVIKSCVLRVGDMLAISVNFVVLEPYAVSDGLTVVSIGVSCEILKLQADRSTALIKITRHRRRYKP